MAFFSKRFRKDARKKIKEELGLIRPQDIERMAEREAALGDDKYMKHAFGVKPGDIPESAPDPEEIARSARRRALSRRRGGRMSTILTGGLGSASQPLGG